jgi:hypothetical protein
MPTASPASSSSWGSTPRAWPDCRSAASSPLRPSADTPPCRAGDVCGIYFFESHEALAAFRGTELAGTIPDAYEAVDVRREVYDMLYSLWPERGPLAEMDRAADASA